MFPKLTVEAIEKFSAKYKHSEEERADILEAYKKRRGDLDDIMESVILAEEDERERIIEVINAAVEASEVPRYEPWPIKSLSSGVAKKKARKSIALDENKKKKNQVFFPFFLSLIVFLFMFLIIFLSYSYISILPGSLCKRTCRDYPSYYIHASTRKARMPYSWP